MCALGRGGLLDDCRGFWPARVRCRRICYGKRKRSVDTGLAHPPRVSHRRRARSARTSSAAVRTNLGHTLRAGLIDPSPAR